jgi:hypothetical protein
MNTSKILPNLITKKLKEFKKLSRFNSLAKLTIPCIFRGDIGLFRRLSLPFLILSTDIKTAVAAA